MWGSLKPAVGDTGASVSASIRPQTLFAPESWAGGLVGCHGCAKGRSTSSPLAAKAAQSTGRQYATAQRLAALSDDEGVVAEAARYINSATVADAAEWLVVIDDVPDASHDLLQQLLALIPSATPMPFSTRSDAVFASVPAATLMRIDALPVQNVQLVLAAAAGKTVTAGVPPFSSGEENAWVRRVLAKTECHALSLVTVGSMIGDSGGAWRGVVEALQRRWMDPSLECSDGDAPWPSVRAALDESFWPLSDEVFRAVFPALGIPPARVCLPVLARLWQSTLGESVVAGGTSAGPVDGVLTSNVEQLVNALIQVGLVRREVDDASGDLIAVNVHPVVGEYALSLLGDAAPATHQQMVDAYMNGLGAVSRDAHGWRRVPFWEVPDDGYWYDNVVRHVAAAGDVCGLISVMDPEWQAARVRESSLLAFQADVELMLTALTAVIRDATPGVTHPPVLLGRVHAALASAYTERFTGGRWLNMETAVMHWGSAVALVPHADAPVLWTEWQSGLGRACRALVGGVRADSLEAAIACCQRALHASTRGAAPLQWAAMQVSLGDALIDRVVGDASNSIEAAIACYYKALEVWTREAAPLDWASTHINLGAAYHQRDAGDQAINMEAAIACYSQALEEHTRSLTPVQWGMANHNLGIAYYHRLLGDKAAAIESAIACFQSALTVRTREASPFRWGSTQHHLGMAFRDRMFGDPATNRKTAAACFESALAVRTRAAAPINWAETQYQMGVMHHGRHEEGAMGAADVSVAVACYSRALKVYTPEAAPQQWMDANCSLLQALVDGGSWSAAVESVMDTE